MANPNLNTTTSVVINNSLVRLDNTTETQVVSNAAASNKAYMIDAIVVSNVDGVNACDITLNFYAAATNTGTATKIAHTVTVPADATLVVVTRDFGLTLKEAQSIYAIASAGGDLHVLAFWKELS
jgi:hypothetical protein